MTKDSTQFGAHARTSPPAGRSTALWTIYASAVLVDFDIEAVFDLS